MTREEILKAAENAVNGSRQASYGSPEDNFSLIARLWNSYLEVDYITSVDVANMMILLKVARADTGAGTADTYIDIAGYAACAGELLEVNEYEAK